MSIKRFSELFPVVSLLVAASIWGMIWYPLRLLNNAGLDGIWATVIAYGAVLLIVLPLLWRQRRELHDHFLPLVVIALGSGWCNLAFILAVLDGTVVRALLLFYLSPLWAVLLGRLILKEYMTRYSQWVLGLAMLGAVMMLWSPELGAPWPQSTSDWLAISAGFSFALSNVFIRQGRALSITSKVMATWWGSILLAAVWLAFTADGLPEVSGMVVLGAVLMGIMGLGLATCAVQYGVTHMPVHRSAVVMLFELIVGAVSSQLLTDEVVRMIEWIGGALILAAAWLTAKRQAEHPDPQ